MGHYPLLTKYMVHWYVLFFDLCDKTTVHVNNHKSSCIVPTYHVPSGYFIYDLMGYTLSILMDGFVPVVPHKAVAEVSKIGNL